MQENIFLKPNTSLFVYCGKDICKIYGKLYHLLASNILPPSFNFGFGLPMLNGLFGAPSHVFILESF